MRIAYNNIISRRDGKSTKRIIYYYYDIIDPGINNVNT